MIYISDFMLLTVKALLSNFLMVGNKQIYSKTEQNSTSMYISFIIIISSDEPRWWHKLRKGKNEAGWYWSCPLNGNRDRIIPLWQHMPMWAEVCEKILSTVGLKSTTSKINRQILYQLSHVGYMKYMAGIRNESEMRPCGYQPMKMLHCRLMLQPYSSRLCRQTAQP